MKKLLLSFLMMIASTFELFAQETVVDSIKLKTKTATEHAKRFKLDKQTWKVYRKHGINYTSDHFKPNTVNSAHPEWLTDSVYVKTFREAAYKKTIRRSLIRHYIVTEAKHEVIVTIGIGVILFLVVYAITSGYK